MTENPLQSLRPTCAHISWRPREDMLAILRYLRKASQNVTLVRFSNVSGSDGRLWIPGQYAQLSVRESELGRCFFGEAPNAVEQLQERLIKWFDIRHYPEDVWEELPQWNGERFAPSRIHSGVQSLNVYKNSSPALNCGRMVLTSLTGSEPVQIGFTLRPAAAQCLVAILGTKGFVTLREPHSRVQLEGLVAGESVEITLSHDDQSRTQSVQLTNFQGFALKNRLQGLLA